MSILAWLRWFVGRADDSDAPWCLIGNVVEQRFAGEAPQSIEQGIKHFPPKTKVYCFPAQWGDGYEKIVVIGRHRGSHRYVRMVIPSRHITNWRMKQVYSPKVLRLIKDGRQHFWKGKAEVSQVLHFMQQRDLAEAANRRPPED